MKSVQAICLLTAVLAALLLAPGCATYHPEYPDYEASMERPAQPLSEEETLSDQIGDIGVALLVVGAAIGGILVPILLFVL